MIVKADFAALKETKWSEYAVRFVLGGLITAGAGIVARKWGPGAGGLFLAFPAVFPASATLLEKHERQKKQRLGMHGARRAAGAAAADAMGAAMGSAGLLAFAAVAWWCIPRLATGIVFAISILAWSSIAGLVWILRKRRYLGRRRH